VAVGTYFIDIEKPQQERAAWTLVEAGARKGLFDRLRQGQVGNIDLKLARQFLESKGAKMQVPPDHREMFSKLVGEAERWLRQNPQRERPAGLGDVDGLEGVFDAIWSGIKAVGGAIGKGAKAVVKVGGQVFSAGQQVQANTAAIQANAEKIAADVANTVKSARGVTDAVSSELTAMKVDSVAGGFFQSNTGKLVMIGGLALVGVMLLSKSGAGAPAGGKR
jgi:hypothetical protein